MNAFKRASFVGIVIFLIGIVIAIYGYSFLLEQNELQKNGIVVTGKVIDINKKAIYRSPFIRFKTRENKTIIFLSKLEINHLFFKYHIGQEVKVIYNKNNPRQAEINAFWERYFAQIFVGSFGVFLMLLGLFLRWLFLKKAKQYNT